PLKKGDVCFRMEPGPLEIAAARMQAQVESVQSLLDAARSGYHSAEADIRSSADGLTYQEQEVPSRHPLAGGRSQIQGAAVPAHAGTARSRPRRAAGARRCREQPRRGAREAR